VRICIVYDHLYPQTVGGLERWLRDLALRLAAGGHAVTYVTMRHWPEADSAPTLPGVEVLALADAGTVYRDDRRSLLQPLRFGWAVARFLRRSGRSFDVVHLGSFPFFPLLAAGALRRRGGYRVEVIWIEVWTRAYWRRYAGALAGTAGWLVQRACIRLTERAYCLSRLHAGRLTAEGYHGSAIVLPGIYAGPTAPTPAEEVDPDLVVYAGRHVREKRLDLLVRGFDLVRRHRPGLRLVLYGDGPDRARVQALVAELGLTGSVDVPGRRPEEEVGAAIARAACLATASEREGYGLVVVEAAARGTPSVVVAGPENAATELLEDGVNGAVAPDASPAAVADALTRVLDGGAALRESTTGWFGANSSSLTLERSLDLMLQAYTDQERT
jgi:glycosyltransferase involved in cell wall biosynthesis